jgi:hypothetical protein
MTLLDVKILRTAIAPTEMQLAEAHAAEVNP